MLLNIVQLALDGYLLAVTPNHIINQAGEVETTNLEGRHYSVFLCHNLPVLNVGNKFTFKNRVGEEVINNTISSKNVLALVKGWHVSKEPPYFSNMSPKKKK